MSQRILKITLLLSVIASAAIQFYTRFSAVKAQEKPKPTIADCNTPNPIDALNEAVLKRFLETRRGFGYERVVVIRNPNTPQHFAAFRAENDEETLIVNDLKANRLNVNLFLAGRRIFENPETRIAGNLAIIPDSPMRGPLTVTEEGIDKSLPDASSEEFIKQTRKALKSFDKGNQYQFTSGKWKVDARPVRATENSCVQCHKARGANDPEAQELKIGDPLGVLLYVYKEKKQKS